MYHASHSKKYYLFFLPLSYSEKEYFLYFLFPISGLLFAGPVSPRTTVKKQMYYMPSKLQRSLKVTIPKMSLTPCSLCERREEMSYKSRIVRFHGRRIVPHNGVHLGK